MSSCALRYSIIVQTLLILKYSVPMDDYTARISHLTAAINGYKLLQWHQISLAEFECFCTEKLAFDASEGDDLDIEAEHVFFNKENGKLSIGVGHVTFEWNGHEFIDSELGHDW